MKRRALFFVSLVFGLCCPARAAEQLAVTLTTPTDAQLDWQEPDATAAGYIVEFINRPGDEWVILGFFPRGKHTYQHPRLAPGTPYAYRVRPFFGPASPPLDVTIAEGLSDQAYADAYAKPEDYSWAPPKKISAAGAGMLVQKSIRNAATAAAAAPANFKAEVMKSTVSGFRLTWTDRASDEEGFMLERVDSPSDFTVVAVVEPDINSFGWALEPPARKGTFRVRAYYYGKASNVASIMTGGDPNDEVPRGAVAKKTGT